MSDAFWTALLGNAPSIVGALFGGVAMVYGLWNAQQAKKQAEQVKAQAEQVKEQAAQIVEVKAVARVAQVRAEGAQAEAEVAKTSLVTLENRQVQMDEAIRTNTFAIDQFTKRSSGLGTLE